MHVIDWEKCLLKFASSNTFCGTVSSNPGVKVIFRKKWLQSIPPKTVEKHVSFQNLKRNYSECHMKLIW